MKDRYDIAKVFNDLENDILDYYIDKIISIEEMENILKWCEKMKKVKLQSIEKK